MYKSNTGSISAVENTTAGVYFTSAVTASTIGAITVTGDVGALLKTTGTGVDIRGSNLNIASVTASETGNAVSDDGIYILTGSNNTIGPIISYNNAGGGIRNSSDSTTFSTITSYGNGDMGVQWGGNSCTTGDIYAYNNSSYQFYLSTDYNIFVANSVGNTYSAYFTGAASNRIGYIIATNNAGSSNGMIYLGSTSIYNRIKGILNTGSSEDGLAIPAGSTYNIIGPSTFANNALVGVRLSSSSNILLSPFSINNTGDGFYISTNTVPSTIVNAASTHNGGDGIEHTATGNIHYLGSMIQSSNTGLKCRVAAGGKGIIATNCTDAGTAGSSGYTNLASNAILRLPASLAASVKGKTTSDSTNTTDTSGTATYSLALDFINFDHIFRGWGKSGSAFPNSDNRGRCSTGTCQVWDWALSSVDTVLLNRSGNGSAINGDDDLDGTCESNELCNVQEPSGDGSGDDDGVCESGEVCNNSFSSSGTCPVQVRGSEAVFSAPYSYSDTGGFLNGYEMAEVSSDSIGDDDGVCESQEICSTNGNACGVGDICAQKFLKAAMEQEGTGGDDDYLCEQGETCIYTPNIGIYQGHGTLGSCTFVSNGGLSSITMKGYQYNGR